MATEPTNRRRLAVARFWFEGNSFTPRPTTLDDFRAREWGRGPVMLEQARGSASELAAVADFAAARPDWEVIVGRCCAATPGGPIIANDFAAIREEIVADLVAARPHVVYLSLHGAAIAADDPVPDLTLLQAVRAALGRELPLTVSFDLHAHLAAPYLAYCDYASVYRTYPHVDMRDVAALAILRAVNIADGALRPYGVIRKLNRVLHSFNMRTAAGPMADLVSAAQTMMQATPGLELFPLGGFAWGDSPFAGAGVMAWSTGGIEMAEDAADQLARQFAELEPAFQVSLPEPGAAIVQALQTPGLVAVMDPADNPYSGGISDTPGLLAALLACNLTEPAVFASLADPALVDRCNAVGLGQQIDVALGGQVTTQFGPPIQAQANVRHLTDGRFVNAGPMEAGRVVELGPTAVLQVGSISVIITSRNEPVIDPAFFALHGIDPRQLRMLAVKGKNHFRAAFGARCAAIVDCDAPGPASLDLTRLPFTHTPRAWLPGGNP